MTNITCFSHSITNTIKAIDRKLKDTNDSGIFIEPKLYITFRIVQHIPPQKAYANICELNGF
jgi:hypothetical protein